MHRHTVTGTFTALSLCLALLCFSPESHAAGVSGQGTWESTLSARSFDGGATIGGYYDSTLNITWLADANAAGTKMTWGDANSWANTLTVGSVSGWRLPTMVDTGASGCVGYNYSDADCGFNVQTTVGSTVYSEMASMFYDTLGNKAYFDTSGVGPQSGYGLSNTGPFSNLQTFYYWTDLAYAPSPSLDAWFFYTNLGSQYGDNQLFELYAWAVHAGDVGVAPVPLPASVWLLLSGLLGMVVLSRRRTHRSFSAIAA